MLELSQLAVRVHERPRGTPLLGPIDLRVSTGEALVIMGETGAGKSLIAQAVMGSLPDTLIPSGEIRFGGTRLDTMSRRDRQALWGRHLTLLPQEPWLALDPLMRAINQVSETHHLVARQSRKNARRKAATDFETLGLIGAERHRPGELSGGMCQRVAFAAALAGGAPLLLADEPTKGLDQERSDRIVELLVKNRDQGGGIVVITHDVGVARKIGGSIVVIKDGEPVEQGQTEQVLESPQHGYTRALIDSDPALWPKPSTVSSNDLVLTAEKLAVGHSDIPLIDNFDLHLGVGERVAVTGPSGIGKTTLLDTIAGLVRPLAGKVKRASRVGPTGVQKIYQDPPAGFSPHVSLGTSLDDVARLHRIDWAVFENLLSTLQIDTAMLARVPSQVSGGELQRIAIARALAIKPAVLLADEPTSRLDPVTQKITMQLLARASDEAHSAVVLVTHDYGLANNWAQRSMDLVAAGNTATDKNGKYLPMGNGATG